MAWASGSLAGLHGAGREIGEAHEDADCAKGSVGRAAGIGRVEVVEDFAGGVCRGGEERGREEANTRRCERIETGDFRLEIGAGEDEGKLIKREGKAIGDVAERQIGVGEGVEESGLECHGVIIPNKTKTARGLFGLWK